MTTANLKMITLLMVSDDRDHQDTLQDTFEAHVEKLHIANSPQNALDIFRREHPEVVIIDSTLYGMAQGLYVELRQLCGADGVIIAMVERDNSPEAGIALSASVDDCFHFATPPELMRRRLKNMLLMKHQMMFHRMTGAGIPPNQVQLAEEKYRHLFDSANDAIFITDMATGRFLDVNRRAVRWLGYSREQLLQMTHFDIEVPLITYNGEAAETVVQQLSTNGHFIFEIGYKAIDGTTFPAEVSSRIFTYDGRRALLNIVRDITRQKQIKAEEDAQRQLAEALRDTAAVLNSTLELDEVINRVLNAITRVLPSKLASVMLIEGEYARVAHYVGYDELLPDVAYLRNLRVEIKKTRNLYWMIDNHKSLVIPDVHEYDGWLLLSESNWISSYMGAPILVEDKVIGFINMDYPEPNRFTQVHADQLMAFANQAGIAIQNARLHEAIRRYADELEKRVQERTAQLTLVNNQLLEQITERQKIEARLDEERNLLRVLIDNIPDEIYVKDLDGRHILVNKAMNNRLSKRAPGGVVLGTTNTDYLPPEKVKQRKQEEYYILYERKSALTQMGNFQWGTLEPTWVLMTRVPIYDNQGQPLGIVGINRDITEVKKAQESVNYIIGGAYCLLWYANVDATQMPPKWNMQVSSEEASMRFLPLNLEANEDYVDAFRRCVLPEDVTQIYTNSTQAIREGKTNYYQEYRCIRADGEIRWLHEEAQITPLENDQYRVVGVCTDITERKLAEETLLVANELLEEEVRTRTKDLIDINKDLVRQVQVREQAEHAEREQRKFSEALSDAAAVLTESLRLSDVLDRILNFAGRVVPPHDAASIILIEDEIFIRHLRFCRYVNGDALYIPADNDRYYLDSLPILRRIHDSKTPIVMQEAEGDADWLDIDEIRWVNSYICVPIQAQGRVIGFLTVASRRTEQFTSAHANRLLTFSNQAGIAIQNAQLFSEVNRNASELRRRVAEATVELESERAQLRAILDAMTEGVLYTDRRNRTRYINTSMTRLTGYTSEEWVKNQSNIWKLMLVDDTDVDVFIRQIQDRILRFGLWQGEVRLRRKEGDTFDASLVVTRVMRGEGELGGAVTVMRDISAEKQLEAQKTRFIATASHELRTPITNIKTRLYLLQKRPDTLDKHMPVLTSVTERMRKLVDDLLDVSRFEHGVITLRREPVELQILVRDIVDTQIPEADKRLLKLSYHAPMEPLIALVDMERIAQVVTNLLTNAINYTPEGGKIVVELRQTYDEMKQSFVELDVNDTGIGIPQHLLQDIFKPFFRVSDYNTGTGLGLSITKEIIELHGGTIRVESEEAEGTCFTVRLPLISENVHHAHEAHAGD